MKKGAILLVALLAAGCSSAPRQPPQPQQPRASSAQMQAVLIPYMNCLARAEPTMDDGVSDARSIAAALRDSCPAQFMSVLGLMVQGYTPNQQRLIAADSAQFRTSTALDVVLKVRASRLTTK